ncbi:DUF1702 family protein [Rheinheimera sp. NSM]|uniref:DUF1702 family protein n=1 Tax=Rheinheimera sp. NSM TaxID=3457884 RepID=UPI004035648B
MTDASVLGENSLPAKLPGILKWIVERRVSAFRCTNSNRSLVTKIASTFFSGFSETITTGDSGASIRHVEGNCEEFFKPFYVEGASLALTASRVLPVFKASEGPAELLYHLPGFKHVIYAGWGWWYAFMPRYTQSFQNSISAASVFSAITIDGAAFARAFLFARPPYFDLKIPSVSNAKKRLWVQGYGRALWFLTTANVSIIERQRQRVGKELSADLDSGLGLASGFAGMVSPTSTFPSTICANKSAYMQGYAFGLTARAMSTPAIFSSWLSSMTPCKKQFAQGLISRCLVEPRSINDCPTNVYTDWQDELRADFQQYEIS